MRADGWGHGKRRVESAPTIMQHVTGAYRAPKTGPPAIYTPSRNSCSTALNVALGRIAALTLSMSGR